MKDYIVTVEETYFDATKFDFNKFYIVTDKNVELKCLLNTVEKDKATFVTVVDSLCRLVDVYPCDVKNGEVTIEEVVAPDEVVRLRKENLNLHNAEEMLQSTIHILNNRVDELEKENTKLRNHIDMFSEEEYCD